MYYDAWHWNWFLNTHTQTIEDVPNGATYWNPSLAEPHAPGVNRLWSGLPVSKDPRLAQAPDFTEQQASTSLSALSPESQETQKLQAKEVPCLTCPGTRDKT